MKDGLPATLAHNDFNQRNVGFRPDVVVLDWELAECSVAQRDLVEMLSFLLQPSSGTDQCEDRTAAGPVRLKNAVISGLYCRSHPHCAW